MRISTFYLLVPLTVGLGCNSDKGDDTGGGASVDGGATDGGGADGGTADGGTADGGTADGGTADGGTADGGTADGGTAEVDVDGDGWSADEDCDDENPDVNPGAIEVCNELDDDCDELVDEADDSLDISTALSLYADEDGDGHGDPEVTVVACAAGDGAVEDASDCDDSSADAHPGLEEVCGDGLDNDCDGTVNDCAWSGELSLADAAARLLGEAYIDQVGAGVDGGDLDGDGLADLVVGGYGVDEGGEDAGAVYIFMGPVSGEHDVSEAIATLVGDSEGAFAGQAVALAGDLDGDGNGDLVIGGFGYDGYTGKTWVAYGPFSGSSSLADAGGSFTGEDSVDFSGYRVEGGSDWDGDGGDDVLVAAQRNDSYAGAVYLLSGPVTGSMDLGSAGTKISGANSSDSLGYWVVDGGDANGDGSADLLLGAIGSDLGGSTSGAAYVVHGPVTADGSVDDLAAARIIGDGSSQYAGSAIANAGDTNDDGYDDIVVGAYNNGTTAAMAGAAYLMLGPVSGDVPVTDAVATLLGEYTNDMLGTGSVGGSDLDGDGSTDFLIGARQHGLSGPSGMIGALYVFFGTVSGTMEIDDAADAKIIGDTSGNQMGEAVSMIGDADGDGLGDLLIGVFGYSGDESHSGAAFLVTGSGL